MNIHPVKHEKTDKNRYCGPGAVSILTGMTSGEAARLIRAASNLTLVKGTHTHEVLRALRACGLGFRSVPVPVEQKYVTRKGSFLRAGGEYLVTKGELTLAGWLKKTVPIRTTGRVFLVAAGNHWQVISGRRYCCSKTVKIVSITDKKVSRRARVTEVWEVTQPGRITIPACARKPKNTGRNEPCWKELEALLKANGIPKGKLVKYDSTITDYVIPPCDHFEQGCSTIHYNWPETLQRIESAIEHPIMVLENEGHWSE